MDSHKYDQLLFDKTVQAIISIGTHGSHHILKIAHTQLINYWTLHPKLMIVISWLVEFHFKKLAQHGLQT